MARAWLAITFAVAGCGYPALPRLGDDGGGSDAPGTALVVTAQPASFLLHANDTRQTLLTITNPTRQQAGIPSLSVHGLTLGSMTFPSGTDTCTGELAPNASCTVTGMITATSAGQVDFQVSATATSVDPGMASLAMTIMTACPTNCGANGTTNCCASSMVPGNAPNASLAGASFYRSYDVAADGAYASKVYPATVSDFRLDTYEVTVGRFRAFVIAGEGTQQHPPAPGAGARMLNSTTSQGGWDQSWNSKLAIDTSTLAAAIACSGGTWTPNAGSSENLPMTCITWYEAMAFCIWDGGYLPTEAEWNYAAAGGSQQRPYPWSNPASSLTISCSYADYDTGGSPALCTSPPRTKIVGAEPMGNGRWGQADLAGNVSEWVLDWFASPYPTAACDNCANLASGMYRVLRGSSFTGVDIDLRAAGRDMVAPQLRYPEQGVRCARPL